MAHCVISSKYPPNIDATKAPLAYGNGALQRLNSELADSTDLVRQRALRSLCDYLHDPQHISSAIDSGLPGSLQALLADSDGFCRYKAAECLFVFSSHSIGRKAIVDLGIIESLASLFDDTERMARKNSHLTIEMTSEVSFGAEEIIRLQLVKTLVDKLKPEEDEIKSIILDTLHFCMLLDTNQALEAGAMAVFTNLLGSESSLIKAKAARAIFDLSMPLNGKNEAIELDTVPRLVQLLKHQDINVVCKATLALEAIAIITPGKYKCIQADAIQLLIPSINNSNSEVRLNALKLMTCLAEAPEGRKNLLPHIEQIKQLIHDEIPIVAKHANIAVKVITWKP